VEINVVNEEGAYVRLLEYNNREALILASNTTRKRVKNVRKLLRVGTQDYMQVISVDKEGGFIDLSKRTVNLEDIEDKKKKFDKAKIVHLIMRLTAHNMKCKLIDLYEAYGWDLYDKFDHAYDAFKLCLTDQDLVFSKITITEEQKKALLASIYKKMAAAPQKLRTTFNLHCYTYEGIEAIKESLLAAKAQTSDEKFKMVFQMIAPPEYKAEVVSLDKAGATERLEKALEIVQSEIKARGGQFKLVQGITRIGTRVDDVDNDNIIANMQRNEDD
jgi:translation initiation factor 2 subunit 1